MAVAEFAEIQTDSEFDLAPSEFLQIQLHHPPNVLLPKLPTFLAFPSSANRRGNDCRSTLNYVILLS